MNIKQQRIILILQKGQPLNQKQISEELGIQQKYAGQHIHTLREIELAKSLGIPVFEDLTVMTEQFDSNEG